MKRTLILAGMMALTAGAALADDPSWTTAHAPYRIAGSIYYVGTAGIGVYLIETPKGDILLDSGPEGAADIVEGNIAALGVKLHDIKYLIETHAHCDHIGGMARLKKDTGAILIASAGDRFALEHGRHVGDNVNGIATFPAVKVDRTIGEGETLSLGGVTLTAHMSPGHTPGDTTWTTTIDDFGHQRTVLFWASTTTAGNVLKGNKAYPGIVADYRLTFRRLKTLKADILVANHPEFADMEAKRARQKAGDADAFVDPGALQKLVTQSQADFEAQLKKEGGR